MNSAAPDEQLRKWDYEVNQVPIEESTLPHRFELQTLRLLAEGEPISADMIGAKLGIPTDLARLVFEASQGKGEWDQEGRLIGSALTLVPTPHQFNLKGKQLYAWCAHDTIFLPALLGMTAEIVSPDPQTGEMIHVIMTPDGPEKFSPESAVLTIFQSAETATGPTSPVCTNSHYFISLASAEAWSKGRTGVSIQTIDEAFNQMKNLLLDGLAPILDQLD